MSQNPPKDRLDAIDDLDQIWTEMRVIWCALTNPNHAEEVVEEISDHVAGLCHRLEAAIDTLKGGKG